MVNNNHSMSYASLHLVNRNHHKAIGLEAIKPSRNSSPRLSREEARHLKILKLKRSDLSDETTKAKIRTAYKKMAKVCHPDAGGDDDQFKKLNTAHEQMLLWAENPQYTSEKLFRTAGVMMASPAAGHHPCSDPISVSVVRKVMNKKEPYRIPSHVTEIILESISDGVFTVDHDWRITSFNQAAERITRIPGRKPWENTVGKCFGPTCVKRTAPFAEP